VDDAAEAEKAEAIAGESGEEESDADSDDGGAGLGSQRLVVKLGDKQQRDLSAGLSSIAAGPANKPGAEVGAKEAKKSGVVYVGRIPFGCEPPKLYTATVPGGAANQQAGRS